MKSFAALASGLVLLAAAGGAAAAARPPSGPPPSAHARPELSLYDPAAVLHGGSSDLAKTPADSFNIYGGVRSDGSHSRLPEGQFNTLNWFPQLQGWNSVDLTEVPAHWHVSTFNAAILDAGVTHNHAMFDGVETGTSGFTTAPGYGNNWNDQLDWYGQANPAINTTTRLTFDFNHDTEPGYDFFRVQFDSAGTMVTLAEFTASNKNGAGQFITPVHFDGSVLFRPNMYVGTTSKFVHERLRVTSDGAWSDEDGLWPTSGAAQVDNVQVRFNGALVLQHGDGTASFEPLGGGVFDTESWSPVAADFAGDFGKLFPQLAAIDPCRIDLTPQIGFIDDGTPPRNAPTRSTGGSTSPTWGYGVEGGWVVNYTGGLTLGAQGINNEYWSPEIVWNDPTTTADDALTGGAFARWNVWQHLPLLNGMFWVWHVRSYPDPTGTWTSWQDRNFVYYGGGVALYATVQADVSDLLVNNPQKVQLALGTVDLADLFGYPGNDATPSPTFDNVSFWKYAATGPAFTTREIDLFNDAFATGGGFNYKRNPADLSVRMDMARDISTGTANAPGDSIIVDVVATVPGTTLAGPGPGGRPVMRWILDANPAFNAVRSLPPGAVAAGVSARGFSQWRGTANGDSARTAGGSAIAHRFFFDVPNDGPALRPYQTNEPKLFFPGDIVRYYIEARDSGAHSSTLPADTVGFARGVAYNRVFTIRALPTLRVTIAGHDTTVTQPRILVVNDFGHRGGEDEWLQAFGQNGLVEGVDFDTYTVQGPSSLVSNGIGSAGAHGANAQQLQGYSSVLYDCGNLSNGLISNGSNANGNDKGDDAGTLTGWRSQAADRFAAYFGDNIGAGLVSQGGTSLTFLANAMGVTYVADDVRLEIGDQTAPLAKPTGQGSTVGLFSQVYVAYGGCLSINQFDSMRPAAGTGAVRAHEFLSRSGVPGQYGPAASVYYARTDTLAGTPRRRVALTFPYGFLYVQDIIPKAPGGASGRAKLLAEILRAFGLPINNGGAVATDPVPVRRLVVEQNHPNPFNPATTIRFSAPARGHARVTIYNLRGEAVATLLDGTVEAGEQTVTWRGVDGRGRPVASGVYLYEVDGFGQSAVRKMALIR
jgi:hypothetical protein